MTEANGEQTEPGAPAEGTGDMVVDLVAKQATSVDIQMTENPQAPVDQQTFESEMTLVKPQVPAPGTGAVHGFVAPESRGPASVRIGREDFKRLVRVYYKVIKEIVLSDNLVIEQSRQIRRMEHSEVMEVSRGPVVDPSVGVFRIHGQALKDGMIGWVTIAGNQGITFLVPGGSVFRVLSPVPLTAELKDDSREGCLRILSVG